MTNETDSDNYIVPACDASPHCPVHGIEVERRKNTQINVKKLEEEIEGNKSRISELLTFKNNLTGSLNVLKMVLATLLFGSYVYATGSYIYGFIHMQEATAKYSELEASTKLVSDENEKLKQFVNDIRYQLNEKINSNTTELRVSNDRYLQIMTQLSEMKRLLQEGKPQ